jgi:hypothetical protein
MFAIAPSDLDWFAEAGPKSELRYFLAAQEPLTKNEVTNL